MLGSARGVAEAEVLLYDINGKSQSVLLKNALCIPSYKQDIFSVQAATDKGASFSFAQHNASLRAPDGTLFNIEQNGKLYYLYNVKSNKISSHSAKSWHQILGHCNINDVLKLENVVDEMKITGSRNFECDTCIKGKMTQFRSRIAVLLIRRPHIH